MLEDGWCIVEGFQFLSSTLASVSRVGLVRRDVMQRINLYSVFVDLFRLVKLGKRLMNEKLIFAELFVVSLDNPLFTLIMQRLFFGVINNVGCSLRSEGMESFLLGLNNVAVRDWHGCILNSVVEASGCDWQMCVQRSFEVVCTFDWIEFTVANSSGFVEYVVRADSLLEAKGSIADFF